MAKKEDRRVKMTKRLLKESLITLLSSKSIGKITISEICEHADINRSTFYTHYSDQYDLLKSIENEYIEKVMAALSTPTINLEELLLFIQQLLQFFIESKAMSQILFSDRADIHFTNDLAKTLYNKLADTRKDQEEIDMEAVEYTMAFVVAGSTGVIQRWIQEDFKTPQEKISLLIANIALPAFRLHLSYDGY